MILIIQFWWRAHFTPVPSFPLPTSPIFSEVQVSIFRNSKNKTQYFRNCCSPRSECRLPTGHCARAALLYGYVTREGMPTSCWAKLKTARDNGREPLLVAKERWGRQVSVFESWSLWQGNYRRGKIITVEMKSEGDDETYNYTNIYSHPATAALL